MGQVFGMPLFHHCIKTTTLRRIQLCAFGQFLVAWSSRTDRTSLTPTVMPKMPPSMTIDSETARGAQQPESQGAVIPRTQQDDNDNTNNDTGRTRPSDDDEMFVSPRTEQENVTVVIHVPGTMPDIEGFTSQLQVRRGCLCPD